MHLCEFPTFLFLLFVSRSFFISDVLESSVGFTSYIVLLSLFVRLGFCNQRVISSVSFDIIILSTLHQIIFHADSSDNNLNSLWLKLSYSNALQTLLISISSSSSSSKFTKVANLLEILT